MPVTLPVPGITGVHFIGMYLTGVHLVGMCLMGVHLTGVHLMGVYLTGVCLKGVYLTGLHLWACTSYTCISSHRMKVSLIRRL